MRVSAVGAPVVGVVGSVAVLLSSGAVDVRTRKRETAQAPRARGVCCGCSASGDGHRIPVAVVKADGGEQHVGESATAPTAVASATSVDGGPGRRDESRDRTTVVSS